MVTFICEYCDQTLKKKQCDNHSRGGCSPSSFICIDCSQTFRGNQYKAHISCISQQQKHWGEYAKPKKTKMIAKQQKPVPQQKNGDHKTKKISKEQNSNKMLQGAQQNHKQVKKDNEWRGWKNQLKTMIKQKGGKIQKNRLLQSIRQHYQRTTQEQCPNRQFIQDKISKIKKVHEQTFIVYNQ